MTPPQDALPVSVSDRNPSLPPTPSAPGALIAPAEVILDEAALCARLDQAVAGLSETTSIRAAATRILQEAQATGRRATAEGIAANPLTARRITRA